jgi:hypothetical protein
MRSSPVQNKKPSEDTVLLEARLAQARQMLQRLERVSVDSVWAHRSSGFRGSLLKWIDWAERQNVPNPDLERIVDGLARFDKLYEAGQRLLVEAARESLSKRAGQR